MRRFLPALVGLGCLLSTALSNSPRRPFSHKTLSPDGQFVFVVLAPLTKEEEWDKWIGERGAEVRAIREKWTASGMYRNDGSITPLWTVDWYAYNVAVPSDGEHVVRFQTPGLQTFSGPTLGFYHRGELVRGYDLPELVGLPFLTSDDWLASRHVDDASQTITVETRLGDRYVFDVRTGEMVSRFRPLRCAVVALVLGIVGLAYFIWRRRRRRLATSVEEDR